jgi:hypothetical protein
MRLITFLIGEIKSKSTQVKDFFIVFVLDPKQKPFRYPFEMTLKYFYNQSGKFVFNRMKIYQNATSIFLRSTYLHTAAPETRVTSQRQYRPFVSMQVGSWQLGQYLLNIRTSAGCTYSWDRKKFS